jgi:hypothetical protein
MVWLFKGYKVKKKEGIKWTLNGLLLLNPHPEMTGSFKRFITLVNRIQCSQYDQKLLRSPVSTMCISI